MLAAVAVLATSCKKNNIDPSEPTTSDVALFTAGTTPSLYYATGKFAEFDKESEQITYTEGKDIYMVSNYEYTKQYTLNIDGKLNLKEVVAVSYTSAGYELDESGELSMEVVKMSDDSSMVWLWNEEAKKGFILKFN